MGLKNVYQLAETFYREKQYLKLKATAMTILSSLAGLFTIQSLLGPATTNKALPRETTSLYKGQNNHLILGGGWTDAQDGEQNTVPKCLQRGGRLGLSGRHPNIFWFNGMKAPYKNPHVIIVPELQPPPTCGRQAIVRRPMEGKGLS